MPKRKNPYDFKYIMQRDCCSELEAKNKVQELKNKTSGSLKTYIKRYGEFEGKRKYKEFSQKSANTKEKFKKKYGSDWKDKWEKYLKSKDSMSENFHKKKYGKNWENKLIKRKKSVAMGLNELQEKYGFEEGSKIFEEINLKRSYSCSFDGLLEKYGDVKAKEISKSKSNPGNKNGMFGKPSPIGSGNGWSGWYEGIHFRSLLELSYLKYLIDNNIKFYSGEYKKYSIEYEIDGLTKNYFPDYILETGECIEIKPKNLINTKLNQIKFKKARKKYGDKFLILTEDDIMRLSDSKIKELREQNKIKFTKRYELKYQEKYNENN